MATVTYINNNFETLTTAMQQLVTMGYFASVEYDSSAENVAVKCYDDSGNAVLTISQGGSGAKTFTIRLEDGTTKTIQFGGYSIPVSAILYYFYICSGGAYLSVNIGTYNFHGIFISKTNNGKTGLVTVGTTGASSSYTVAGRANVVWSIATDDDPAQINTAFSFVTPTLRNQTQLVTIPTCNAAGNPSYFPDVYYTFTAQYTYTNNTSTPPINCTIDGKQYLWVGYYMIADN